MSSEIETLVKMVNTKNKNGSSPPPPNYVFCPVKTYDYRIERGKFGLELVANRNVRKGEYVFEESMEFPFTDVKKGDFMLFVKNYEEEDDSDSDSESDSSDSSSEESSDTDAEEEKKTEKGDNDYNNNNGKQEKKEEDLPLPLAYPIDEGTLFLTHGVQMLVPNPDKESKELKERWHLESPGMFIDHSCDPNLVDASFDLINGGVVAARDIAEGEPFTCDYAAFDYEEDGTTFECRCGAANCRKKNNGFAFMTPEEKERMLSQGVTDAVKARHAHSLGLGPPVSYLVVPTLPRTCIHAAGNNNNNNVPRLVVPGPSLTQDDDTPEVLIRPCEPTTTDDTVGFGLFAAQDVKKGSCVYTYWSQPWPIFPNGIGENSVIDMVSGMTVGEGDAPEGTVVRIDPRSCASRDAQTGCYHFTGYDLLTHHSCDPNIMYDFSESENWRTAYACRDIEKGEQLFVDFNCCMWDRTTTAIEDDDEKNNCRCGSDNCRGTAWGFRHLAPEAQDELSALNWRRAVATSYLMKGKALSPFIRKQLLQKQQ